MRIFIILIALLGLASCSQKSAKVKLELTSSFSFGGSAAMRGVSQGGLMVWGLSKKGDSFSRVLSNSDAIELDLPNDKWTFTAVAWESSTETILDRDQLRCARSNPMDLKGEPVQINLELKTTTCEDRSFRGGVTTQSSVKLNLCQNALAVGSVNDACTNNAADSLRKSDKAPVRSVRLRMMEFDKFGNNVVATGPGLSRCVNMTDTLNGLWITPPDLAIPVGDPNKPDENPFRMELEFYWKNIDCSEGSDLDYGVTQLPKGLVSPGHKFFVDATNNNHVAFINVRDELVCNGRGDLADFPGGDGTKEFPWVICSPKQLYKIHSSDLAKSFRLAADIDLNPFSKGLSASAPAEWPTAASCWEEGQNWQPIGYNSTCGQVASGFQGSFFGGGHTIKGLRARMDTDKVGFIGEWSPTSAGHMVTGLIFDKIEIEGRSRVGGIIGSKTGSNYALIANSELRGGEVSADKHSNISSVGGILGHGEKANLLNLKTSQVKIEGEGEKIGGIFGSSVDAQILSKLVSRSYVGGPNWASSQSVGGIGGRVESPYLIAGQFGEWASESIVVGKDYVGGLLGEWGPTGSTTLRDVYATGSVTLRGDKMGGLFGKNAAGVSLDRAYFAGSLLNLNPNLISVGWVSGYANTMTIDNTYVMTEPGSLLPRSGAGDTFAVTSISTTGIFTPGSMPNLSGPWVHLLGDKPRLGFESHPCSMDQDADGISPRRSLAIQKAKWGSASKPMMICRKDQFAELTNELGSGKIGVIVGALNLGSSALHVPPDLVAGAYLTGEGGYIHGLRRIDLPAGAFNWAPFGTIAGMLENLVISGIDLRVATAVAPSSISGLAVTNNGSIKNVQLLSGFLDHSDMDVRLNGLVDVNNGTMTEVDFEGTLSAGATGNVNIAGLVNSNTGTIQDSEAAGSILLADGGNNIGGVARTNSGSIKRVSVKSKLTSELNTIAANDVGMVAVTNTGTIQDVHVTTEAYWSAYFAPDVGQVVKTQSGNNSVLERIIVEGFLYDTRDVSNFTNGNLSFVKTQSGTINSIYAVPAGRLIAEAPHGMINNCSGQTISMHPSFNLPTAFAPYVQLNMLSNYKVVWAVFDNGDGSFQYAHVTDWTNDTSDQVDLGRDCESLGYNGNTAIRFVQDFNTTLEDATGNLTVSPYVGFAPVPSPFVATNFAGPEWNANISGAPVANTVVARGTPGTDWILDIFAEYLETGSNTTPKPIWEVEGNERIELFRIKK